MLETANNPIEKVRQLQRRLWVCAKQSRTRRFHALYDRIYRSDVLWEAWKRVRSNKGAAGVDAGQAQASIRELLSPFERTGGENPYAIHADLQECMQSLVGIIRTEGELRKALAEIAVFKQRLARVKVAGGRDFNPAWHLALDLYSMLSVSEAVTLGAIARKESRGGHTRDDYPMADDRLTERAATVARCPWCSADLPATASSNCPTCGATLVEPDGSVPGVNAIDADAIVRAARAATPVRRSRLLSWISGEDGGEEETPAPPGSLAPPPPDVRREMLRLELQAELTNLQAEAESIVSETEADAREARLPDAGLADQEDHLPPAVARARLPRGRMHGALPPVRRRRDAAHRDPRPGSRAIRTSLAPASRATERSARAIYKPSLNQ